MTFIHQVVTAVPEHPLTQADVRDLGREVLKGKVPFVEQALKLFANAGVDNRYLVRPVAEILANDDLTWRNKVYAEACIQIGTQLMDDLLHTSGIAATDIDLIITTSCTGFMIPSVDAYLINHFRMRHDTKRLPLTELGCAAGAMALSRAREYLMAYPDHRVVVMAIEAPSLTYRTKDFRVANLVSAALFGDGGAAVLLSGKPSHCELVANRTHFFHDTPTMMGFDLSTSGFKILLDKHISELIRTDFGEPLTAFLAEHHLRPEDIQHFVFHPGGRKIMDNIASLLDLNQTDLAASRHVLRQVGNLSSASILWVLAEVLAKSPSGWGILTAFGPGFNAEMLLARFHVQK